MAKLYTNLKGQDVTTHSYSSGSIWRDCRRKYKFQKIAGLRRRDQSAALEFGKAVEAGIQFWFEDKMREGSGVDYFKAYWIKHRDAPFKYTDQEKDWESLYSIGTDALRVLECVLPTLPIRNPRFQLNYRTRPFPNTEYHDLEFQAYVDMLSTLDDGTQIVVDIKTAKTPLDVSTNMLALDPQLRAYAWVTGISRVAFLNIVKARPNSFSKGDEVTLLESNALAVAGEKVVVWKHLKDIKTVLVGEHSGIQELEDALAEIKGKGSTDRKEDAVAEAMYFGRLTPVYEENVTKVRVQFLQATISPEDQRETGQSIGEDMLRIKQAGDTGIYPADPSVRFPSTKCTYCEYRGECTGDKKLSEMLLVQIAPSERDWLDDLPEEE